MSIYYPGMEFENPESGVSASGEDRAGVPEGAEMPVTKVDDLKEFQSIISQEEKVLVKFEAAWCMPCKAMASVVEEVARMHPDVKVLAVDIEGDGIDEALQEYDVRSVPTFVRLQGGSKVRSTVGAVSKAELSSLLGE